MAFLLKIKSAIIIVSQSFDSNAQSFELGMDFDKINDMKYVKESLPRLDAQFDLILITEHFWEGIVLLKHMLCSDYSMLFNESKNKRHYAIKPLNEKRQAIFDAFHVTRVLNRGRKLLG